MPENRMEPFAVSAGEAARLLGVSKPTIYTLMGREDFPSFKVGNRTLVSVDGLRNWIAAQTEPVAVNQTAVYTEKHPSGRSLP